MKPSCLVLVLLVAGAAWSEPLSCTIVKVTGLVEVQLQQGAWEEAKVGMRLAQGDQVDTGYKSTATLQFPDRSAMEIKPMTLALIRQLEMVEGKVRSRVWMRAGEVKAQVGRLKGVESDFQIETATCTASVRGTKIHRVRYTPATGTIVQMGSEGHLVVQAARGRAGLSASDATQVRELSTVPPTPGDVDLLASQADLAPGGLTVDEQLMIQDLGGAKTMPMTMGGSGLLGTMGTTANGAAQVWIPVPELP